MRVGFCSFKSACRRGCGARLFIILLAFGPASVVIAGENPRLLSEVHNAPLESGARSQRLGELFQASSNSSGILHRQVFHHQRQPMQNLWITLPATREDRGIFIIGAHTDAMPGSAGVIDNWSSCVMLAALYQEMQSVEREHTFIFIGFAGEEHGQNGSRAFVEKMDRKMRSRVRGMINLECLGVGELRTWSNRSADDLENIFMSSATERGIPAYKQALFGYSADSIPFQQAGIPAITLHSLSGPMLSIINTSADDGSQISDVRYFEAFNLLSRFLVKLDRHADRLTTTDRELHLRPAITALRGESEEDYAHREIGVRLEKLSRWSKEYRAGLRSGDLVTAIDGAPVRNPRELQQALLTIARGSEVEMVITPTADESKVVRVEY